MIEKLIQMLVDGVGILGYPGIFILMAMESSLIPVPTELVIVFSLDSVITAVGLVQRVSVMVIAIIGAVAVMLFAAKPIGLFIDSHPTIKMLALSFLILIGFTLVAEGFDVPVPKGYIYFAMGFSVVVELLNIRMHRRRNNNVLILNNKIEFFQE